jgi:hypothetical protein
MAARKPFLIPTSGEGAAERSVLSRLIAFWRIAVYCIDVSDCRRTAESVLAVEPDEIRDVIAELAKVKRLSIVMRNLNRLMDSPADREFGRRALRHLGFLDD